MARQGESTWIMDRTKKAGVWELSKQQILN